jgi:hypothetical protein
MRSIFVPSHGRGPRTALRRVVRSLSLPLAGATLSLAAAAQTITVDPDDLRATIVSVRSAGALCPEGSVGVSLSGDNAAVFLSQSASGVQTARCTLTFEIDVPEGLSMGMPTTILRGVAFGRTRLERRYAFEGAGASNAFMELPSEEFQIADAVELSSRSCSGARRVRYSVDVTAQLQSETTFFQLDSVDLDTTYRFGTDYRFCDPGSTLEVEPGAAGDFCAGPQERPCAEGLSCELQQNSTEGSCVAP